MSLCEYVWRVATAPIILIAMPIITAILAVMFLGIAFFLLMTFGYVITGITGFSNERTLQGFELQFVVLGISALFLLLPSVIAMNLLLRRSFTAFKKSKILVAITEFRKGITETFALWEAYFQAKKEKMACPTVTFID